MFPVSFHRIRLTFILFLAVQSVDSVTYASAPVNPGQPELHTSYNPLNSLAYDQIVARIPLNQASISSVALANLNVALHYAKQQAEITLCNRQWTSYGSIVFQQGPVIERDSSQMNEVPSWHYNVLRQPGEFACGTGSRTAFFLELSRHLPAWVQIRPAGQLTAFRQGETVLLEQETFAIK